MTTLSSLLLYSTKGDLIIETFSLFAQISKYGFQIMILCISSLGLIGCDLALTFKDLRLKNFLRLSHLYLRYIATTWY